VVTELPQEWTLGLVPPRSALALLLLMAASCGSSAKPACTDLNAARSEAADATWSDPPTSAEIIDLILRSAALEIRGEQPGCDSVFGAPLPRFTVGEYVSFLLGTAADEPNVAAGSRIEAECARDGEAWACSLWVAVGEDGESPWRYGLKFRVSGAPPAIDPESFECPGGA
jgi:hypothetical protein